MQNKSKTQPNTQSTTNYLKTLDANAKKEAKVLIKVFKEASGSKPTMWGNIVGFGSYHYKYDSGREGDFMATGFAMRKSGPTIYIMPGYQDYSERLDKLGVKYKLGKSCLYLKNIEGLDQGALQSLIKVGLKDLNKVYKVKK